MEKEKHSCCICGEEINNNLVLHVDKNGRHQYCCLDRSELIRAINEPGGKERAVLVKQIWNTNVEILRKALRTCRERKESDSIIRLFEMAIILKGKEAVRCYERCAG